MEKLWLQAIIAGLVFGMGIVTGMAINDPTKEQIAELKQNEVVIQKDGRLVADNKVTLERLDQMTKELIDGVPEPDNRCLDSNDVDRLRKLWPESPDAASRSPGLF